MLFHTPGGGGVHTGAARANEQTWRTRGPTHNNMQTHRMQTTKLGERAGGQTTTRKRYLHPINETGNGLFLYVEGYMGGRGEAEAYAREDLSTCQTC